MVVEPETTEAETKPKTKGRMPKLHQVQIVYVKDEEYKKSEEYEPGQHLEVYDYPPKDLRKGDRIVFIPLPSGELELTFPYGSNFTEAAGQRTKIMGEQPEIVMREEPITDGERGKFSAKAQLSDGWTPDAPKKLLEFEKLGNAFPFLCVLTAKDGTKYTGGFPHRPVP